MMRLRKLEAQDAGYMLEWMHDPSINVFFQKNLHDMQEEDVLNFIDKADSDQKNIHFAVANDENEYLGTISLKNIDYDNENAEYAISMRKKAMGTGAAKWATAEILKYGFSVLGLKRIYLNVLSENGRAVRFYEKFGFAYEGEFKKHLKIRGEFKDLKWFASIK